MSIPALQADLELIEKEMKGEKNLFTLEFLRMRCDELKKQIQSQTTKSH